MATKTKQQIIENEDGTFQVLSSKGDKYYLVNHAHNCECPAYSFHREKKCRHLKLLLEKGYIAEGEHSERLSASLPKFHIIDGKVVFTDEIKKCCETCGYWGGKGSTGDSRTCYHVDIYAKGPKDVTRKDYCCPSGWLHGGEQI